MITLITGPSGAGKGTRILSLMDSLTESPEIWVRDLDPNYPEKFKPITREVGHYYSDSNLFFLGRHKKIGGWDSIDTLVNYQFESVIHESISKGHHVVADINAAFLGPKMLKQITQDYDNRLIAFHHSDKEEMFRRLNSRRSNKVWNEETYKGTNAERANHRVTQLDAELVDSSVEEDWLIHNLDIGFSGQ